MQEHGIVLNGKKCMLGVPEVQFLGHMVYACGIIPLPEKVAALYAFLRPATVGELMAYLEMVNFYRRFIRGAAGVLKPLTDALRGAGGKATKVEWSTQMLQTFERSKQQIVAVTHLAHPGKKVKLALSVNASSTHIGAALQQEASPGSLQPLEFFSRKLNVAEQKYSTFDRELLAVYAVIRHFRWVPEGRLTTSCSPLPCTVHRQSDAWSAPSSCTSPMWPSTHPACGWQGECGGRLPI